MKLRSVFVTLFVLLSACWCFGQDSQALRLVARDVYRLRHSTSSDHAGIITQLQEDKGLLDDLMGSGKLSAEEMAAAYYYRASVAAQINGLNFRDRKRIDEKLARQALADIEKMVSGGTEDPKLGATFKDGYYMAGSVAKNHLHDNKAAYAYWEKCADQAHAGCMNIMAEAHVTGEDGQKIDYAEAMQYHLRVFNTGTAYRCAGIFSAMSIAAISFFTGTPAPQGDSLFWVTKANNLQQQLAATDRNPKVCNVAGILTDEFLYRLAGGERNQQLLDQASAKLEPESSERQAIIGLLSDQMTATAALTAASMAKTDYQKCSMYFDALWYEELTKHHDVAEKMFQHIAEISSGACATEMVFAKKFGFTSAVKKD